MIGADLGHSGCILIHEHQKTTISDMFVVFGMIEGRDLSARSRCTSKPRIERWHHTLKNNFLSGDLDAQIDETGEHYKHQRYQESRPRDARIPPI